MTYDTKNRVLHIGVYEKVKLSKLEHKLIICLSSENIATNKEIAEYLYGVYDKYSHHTLRLVVYHLREKTKKQIKIRTVKGIGLIMESEIYFE